MSPRVYKKKERKAPVGVYKLCADCRTRLSSHKMVRCTKCHLKHNRIGKTIKELDAEYNAQLRRHKGVTEDA